MLVKQRDAPIDAEPALQVNIGPADVDALHALLDARNLAALDKFSLLSPSLSGLLGAVCFARLRDAMEHPDFPLGAQLLRESRRPTDLESPLRAAVLD
jgi:hypothetical protein